MTTHVRLLITAAVVGFGLAVPAQAQTVGASAGWRATTARSGGDFTGIVKDATGSPVAGAIVSAVGSRTVTGTTDVSGRFTFSAIPAGEYLVRVHRSGFAVGHSLVIRIRPGLETSRSFVLRPNRPQPTRRDLADRDVEVLAAGFVGTAGVVVSPDAPSTEPDDLTAPGDDHDHSELAWRLRHLPRNVLKEAVAAAVTTESDDTEPGLIGRAMTAPARAAYSLFADAPLTGQFNLLTTGTFDTPHQFLSDATLARGVAYVSVGSAVGPHGDWSAQGALTQGDVASWAFAASFVARPRAGHRYEAGMTYAAQRYTGANPDALEAVADGTRNAGTIFAYDRWSLNRKVTLVYGARYARYGYVEESLFSPRARLEIGPFERYTLAFTASRREEAPGAEEFLPSGMQGPWLPPELTFSPLAGERVVPERTAHYEVSIERPIGQSAASVIGVRAFQQRTSDQIATLFGIGTGERSPAELGHYHVASAGDVLVRGWGVSFTRSVVEGIRGSVDYRVTTAHWQTSDDEMLLAALALPALARPESERLHDLTTSVETEIPQTATRVFALYRLSNAAPIADDAIPTSLSRFDVRVTQSLPFLAFTNADWEMLIGVRNLFRDMLAEGSVYDELLVLRPPKRVVGGLRVRF